MNLTAVYFTILILHTNHHNKKIIILIFNAKLTSINLSYNSTIYCDTSVWENATTIEEDNDSDDEEKNDADLTQTDYNTALGR